MKVQLFRDGIVGVSPYVLRLKDGVYERVLRAHNPCTAKGLPLMQKRARAIDKTKYIPLITSPNIGIVWYDMPDDAEIYTAEEIRTIDHTPTNR